MMNRAVQIVRNCAKEIRRGVTSEYDTLIQAIGEAQVVMIGEASHGTHEFYKERAELTKRLILEKKVTVIAVEADWPDAFQINRYVTGLDEVSTAEEALGLFSRFPRWMWRNEVVLDFTKWLRNHNDSVPEERKVHFYGLDLYSMFESAHEVLDYLRTADPELYKLAKQRYGCFDIFGQDSQRYGMITAMGKRQSCKDCCTKVLVDMLKRYTEKAKLDGVSQFEDEFYAKQNAKVVKDAEEYYRGMFTENTWNLRDKHMVETLKDILQHHKLYFGNRTEGPVKAVVWAHNSHLGAANATESKDRGEFNIGQLVREYWGMNKTYNVGFTTYTGTVTAASDWDEPYQMKRVNPGLPESYEQLMHQVGKDKFFIINRSNDPTIRPDTDLVRELNKERLERAIGVIYRPDTERMSHYFYCKIASQFDAVIHIENTTALKPLDKDSELTRMEEETFPSGL